MHESTSRDEACCVSSMLWAASSVRSSHQHPAVHVEHMAGDVTRIGRSQKAHSVRNLLVGTRTPKWNNLGHILAQLRAQHFRHCGLDPSRSNRVDCDAARRHFTRDRHSKADQPGLRRGVIRLSRLAHLSKDAGDVNDSSPTLFQHGADHRLDAEIRSSEVGIEHGVPIRTLHAHDKLIAGDTGIVYQDVDLAESVECSFEPCFDLVFLSDVHCDTRGLSAGSSYFRFNLPKLLHIACSKCHAGTLCREPQRASPTNSLRCSRDKSKSAFKTFHKSSTK